MVTNTMKMLRSSLIALNTSQFCEKFKRMSFIYRRKNKVMAQNPLFTKTVGLSNNDKLINMLSLQGYIPKGSKPITTR